MHLFRCNGRSDELKIPYSWCYHNLHSSAVSLFITVTLAACAVPCRIGQLGQRAITENNLITDSSVLNKNMLIRG